MEEILEYKNQLAEVRELLKTESSEDLKTLESELASLITELESENVNVDALPKEQKEPGRELVDKQEVPRKNEPSIELPSTTEQVKPADIEGIPKSGLTNKPNPINPPKSSKVFKARKQKKRHFVKS